MNLPNNGALAQRFTENSQHFNGNKARASTTKSNLTLARQNAMQQVYLLAQQQGVSVDDVVTKVLKNSLNNLRAYIVSKGETPVPDPSAQVAQAILLRAADIGTTATVLDTDDEDALEVIENAENEAIDTNSPEASNVLPVSVQGAISCALQYLSDQSGKTMAQNVKSLHAAAKINRNKKASNFLDDIGDPSDDGDWLDWITGSSGDNDPSDNAAADNSLSQSSIGSSLANIPGGAGSPITVAGGIPNISTSASSLPTAGGGSSSGSIFSTISNILGGITQVAGSVSSASGAVKSAIGNVGANSISTYVNNNKTSIILIALALIVIIFIVVYVARH